MKKRILIIEDEESIIKMYAMKLEKEGYLIDLALDGQTGLNKALENKYDIILLDIIMPKLDGFDVLNKIREANKKIPIVILSNLGQEEDKKKAKNLGANSYLIKADHTPSTILKAIKKYLA